MKIGIVASIWIAVPPKDHGFGAQEYLAYELVEGLIKRGHEVTLFASGDSKTNAKLVSVTDIALRDVDFPDNILTPFELMHVQSAISRSDEFDIINNHILPLGLPLAEFSKCPIVHTLHHQIYPDRAGKFLYEKYKDQSLVSISDSQRENMKNLNYVKTIYNGTDTNFYSFNSDPGDNFAVMTRLKRYKGVHTAIEVANNLGIGLKIAAPLPTKTQPDFKEVNEYWLELDPQIKKNSNIEYLGSVSGQSKLNLLQNSRAFLFPVERPEPFGMTIIESMACGTPVIAFNQGAVNEIIEDGLNGYVVKSNEGIKGFEEAINKLNSLSSEEYLNMRRAARKTVEDRFSIEQMVENYEKIFLQTSKL